MELPKLKRILEAVLMASGSALSLERLQTLFDDYDKPSSTQLREALASLQDDFSGRGIELIEVASGYRLQVHQDVAAWVTRLWDEKPQRYSRALLETVSLIAYRQPITRGDIEDVRGVAVSSQIIRTLIEREWVRVVGHRDVPGRPAMYATTKEFLDYFSLKTLDELPTLAEIKHFDDANQSLELINAEKQASVTREYDFSSDDDVAARGEDVLAQTEVELEQAAQLVQQVEDNVFNQPEPEPDVEPDVEPEPVEKNVSNAEHSNEKLSVEAQSEQQSASFSGLAEKTARRLASDVIADHQAKVRGEMPAAETLSSHTLSSKILGADKAEFAGQAASSLEGEEALDLRQQQERLMQQLIADEQARISLEQDPKNEALSASEAALDLEGEAVIDDQALADEQALEQQVLKEEQALQEQVREEALMTAEALAEQEQLAEQAMQDEQQRLLEQERLEQLQDKHEVGQAPAESVRKASLFSTD